MSASNSPRIIVVVSATGNQGSGVIRALLDSKTPDDGRWHVRGITRDPNSTKAKQFLAEHQTPDQRLFLVAGHVFDQASLEAAFTGAHGVFAMTSETHAGKVLEKPEEMKHEIESGRNMVLAAEACRVQHFVFSSLPDMVSVTGGRYPNLYHMNNKYEVEKIVRERLDAVTCLIPGFFYTNLRWPQYTDRRSDGVVRIRIPIPRDQVAQWTDPSHDMGVFAAKVFELGVGKTRGKTYCVLSPRVTPDEMVAAFTKVTGQPAVHDPITPERFGEMAAPFVGPAFKEDAKEMMEWASVAPADKICYGAFTEDQDRSFEELGLKASSFEEWLARSGWTGPA
ncbi:NAD(P)-binding protein [Aspergillus homomorphus CBS 101889]|uniref:NAD(P)-binding protein n=1 Tax=Aspergillus homomorphus (strain CBS 101889) TaxID=1450537 RepID=A0A395HZD7_ASPHC|nr:NAD(P)-binding protein [Aspergillus homomorphus CBS 101889]RAL13292.1 NAD(P)-binding protein [Aspergillus homomorphus CBS 101889]